MNLAKQVLPARPQVHFTPERYWINDPNGLIFHQGKYHLFFQHNPEGHAHRNMSWGHAVSEDLHNWTQLPLAIAHDNDEEIFSGSVVFDENNSSGFGSKENPPLVAVYTSAYKNRPLQAQSLAYSLDGGLSWQKYSLNPVLNRGTSDFRDPKVFRYTNNGENYWVMVTVEAVDHQVLFYRSENLKSWTLLSTFGPQGAVGGVWECPDLFPLELDANPNNVKWVLIVSLSPGGVYGGSGTQYFVGNFDGNVFTPDNFHEPITNDKFGLSQLDWLDWGRDCYAGVTFNGLPSNKRTLIAWMSNWEYVHSLPYSDWRNGMTIPRQLSLKSVEGKPQLFSAPQVPEGVCLVDAVELTLSQDKRRIFQLPESSHISIDVDRDTSFSTTIAGELGEIGISFNFLDGFIEIERPANSDVFGDNFSSLERTNISLNAESIHIEIILDTESVELFLQGGLMTYTYLTYLGPNRNIEFNAPREAVISSMSILDYEVRR